MDTVSMLDKMRFYCQPILPLVYDESMSYYETLCKVVGQLNTTGETVNKLNEGLTGEIADRQAADAELDERLKVIEDTNKKIHFLVFDGANPNGGFPTRHELYQWVEAGDAIFTLLRTYEEGRGQIYVASCSYNAGNWGSEASNDFSIIVPIETSYDATRDYAVKQKVAKLTIPPIPQTNLNAPWGLQIIEINTPSTSAEGIVNLVAVINDSDSVNCSITPSEFLGLYNMTRGGKNLCVAVNAKLAYDGLARSSSVATVDTTNRKIRIAFERDYGTFIENGVKQLNKTLDYIIGDANTNVWTHETIDSKTLDFSRYEGFQFTRGAHNVITANDESTPSAVYAQYNSDTSGKIYQNLPVCLIDTVDNAEYWNGVFDIKDGNHMTFTFVTSNYATASDKMLVRVIELSADANTTVWKYAEKEFELPITGSFTVDDALSDTSTNPVQNKVVKSALDGKLSTRGGEISGYLSVGLTVSAEGSVSVGRTSTDTGIHFEKAGSDVGRISHGAAGVDDTVPLARLKVASPTEDDDAATKAYVDNNAVGAGAVRYDAMQSLTFEQKQRARKNIEAADREWPTITGGVSLCPEHITDSNFAAHVTSTIASGNDYTVTFDGGPENWPVRVKGIRTPTDADTDAAANVEYVKNKVAGGGGSTDAVLYTTQTLTDAQKKQARDNIDAEMADFVVNGTVNSNKEVTLDKTFAQIQAAIQDGKQPVVKLSESGEVAFMPMVASDPSVVIFSAVADITDRNITDISLTITSDDAIFNGLASPVLNDDGALLQYSMESDPSAPMDIATKKYVDDHAGSRVALSGTVEGEVSGYTSATYLQIVDEIAKTGNIWLTISGETVRMASYKQSVDNAYTLVFFGAGDGALIVKYEVTASVSSASLTVTGS